MKVFFKKQNKNGVIWFIIGFYRFEQVFTGFNRFNKDALFFFFDGVEVVSRFKDGSVAVKDNDNAHVSVKVEVGILLSTCLKYRF